MFCPRKAITAGSPGIALMIRNAAIEIAKSVTMARPAIAVARLIRFSDQLVTTMSSLRMW
jgi:hypothetical protein